MKIKFFIIGLGLLILFPSPPSLAERGILGGLLGLSGCIKGCREEDSKRSESSCSRFCRCTLEFDSADLIKWITKKNMGEAASTASYQAMTCRAQVWPDVYTPPPSPTQEQQNEPKKLSGDEAPLSKQTVDFIDVAMLGPKLQPLVRQATTEGISNHRYNRITCVYGPYKQREDGESVVSHFSFWYRSLPGDFVDWKKQDSEMTLLRMGGVATVNECPAKLSEAEAIHAAGRQRYESEKQLNPP
ncbi:hypothetical protein SAMN05216404_1179 [Nitrosospira multiformis]|uniref:Uncharacterized protein n=1 Tax=Nitrosospira multiformis TaxID=1231 RepID=A0A1H8NME2_9PROT|nr:hypothetical protein [Nitrosospira multiformis]SEO30722.1 hypothetical protein SAMN05216404_1179 [Nitrosospira multiformis]